MIQLPSSGQPKPANPLILAGILSRAKRYLQRHGCTVTEEHGRVTITYPEGATSVERYPRTVYAWYCIHLPDGTELWEARPCLASGESCLFVPEDASRRL